MLFNLPISLRNIVRLNPVKVSATWLLVCFENILLILLPLFIGYTIDGVLQQDFQPLLIFAGVLFLLVFVSVVRRFYDTRIYSAIRVQLAKKVERNLRGAPVSVKDARLTMSRELVNFLEEDLPTLITAVIQLIATLVILASFELSLALCVLGAGFLMLLIYFIFHNTFTRLNGAINDQLEQQVTTLTSGPISAIRWHFERLKQCEIKLSDTEAWLYGLIFLTLFAAVLVNLYMVSFLPAPSAGEVFAIVTYSLEFVDSAILLPIALQTLSRLSEISARLNQKSDVQEAANAA